MAMAETKIWTLDELHSLPDDNNKYELLHGELFVTPAPSFDHETIIARLQALLVPFVMANNLGYVYSGNSVVTDDESELIPDLLVRQPAAPKTSWKSAPLPVLVVEVISRTTRRRDYEFKKPFYADEVRIPEYWILDGDRRVITVVRPDLPARSLHDRLTWNPPETSASLEISLVDVFGPQQ